MFGNIISGTVYGLNCYLIKVEIDVSSGLPCFAMVGSLSPEVRESAERVRIALKNTKVTIPAMHVAINLSPADIRKSGTGFDLPIALGLLTAMGKIMPDKLKDTLILGELGLNGEIKRVNGVMPMTWEAKKNGISRCIIPKDNAAEAALIQGMKVIGVENLVEAIDYLMLDEEKQDEMIKPTIYDAENDGIVYTEEKLDFLDITGQENLKRGALIAASGKHHMLIMGPPGTGKTMVAKRIPTILPPLSAEEMMDVTSIYSIAGKLSSKNPYVKIRPFVSPHHTMSPQAMSGGGSIPRPGAVSLAHKGILFLDELPEFQRKSIDMLREPLEEKSINISRAIGAFTYPADIMLIAAMNPCPCGNYPDINKCNCTPLTIRHYLSHISGPILDRIDICITASKLTIGQLQKNENGVSSKELLERVMRARHIQKERYKGLNITCNSELQVSEIKEFCQLGHEQEKMMERVCSRLDVSARAYHRILKVARTIADLEDSQLIKSEHITEALCYRPQLPEV